MGELIQFPISPIAQIEPPLEASQITQWDCMLKVDDLLMDSNRLTSEERTELARYMTAMATEIVNKNRVREEVKE